MYVASTFRRTLAHLSDEAIGSVFWIPLLVKAWVQAGRGHDIVLPWFLILSLWTARVVYEVLCVYVLQGLPAQRFFGLKVISTYHPELGLGLPQVVIRVLLAQFKYLLGPSIYFLALFHKERQHLGDILAETRVVQIQERNFLPKARTILGSILIYVSLVSSLGDVVSMVAENRVDRQGIWIEWPEFNVHFDGAGTVSL
jgi:uncharacterized RDD family membrane protein YckC